MSEAPPTCGTRTLYYGNLVECELPMDHTGLHRKKGGGWRWEIEQPAGELTEDELDALRLPWHAPGMDELHDAAHDCVADAMFGYTEMGNARAALVASAVNKLAALRETPPQAVLDRWFANELHDFRMICDHLSETYMYFSDGKISKPTTLPREVFACADDAEMRRIEDATKEYRDLIDLQQKGMWEATKFSEEIRRLTTVGLEIMASRIVNIKEREAEKVRADAAETALLEIRDRQIGELCRWCNATIRPREEGWGHDRNCPASIAATALEAKP